MIFILTAIFFTWAIVMGITIVTQHGMALYSLRESANELFPTHDELENKIEYKTGKSLDPIILCEWCMPSIYSFLGFAFTYILYGWDIKYLLFYPIVVAISSVLCGITWGICKFIIKNI